MLDLPKHPVLRGHPLHAMLSDLPIGLLPGALAASVLAGRPGAGRRARRMAGLLTVMTFGSAATAAGAGIWDWLTIPRSHPAWLPATIHGSINVTGVALLGTAVARPGLRVPLLGAVGGAALVGAWLGGEVVFAHGWRVKPAEEYEIVARRVRDRNGSDIAEAQRQVAAFESEKTFLG